ncbi:MAG TPA: flavodoxin domain-containing protein [Acidimicrobiia bacterium]|nr:flavodoxin domain-containing protein [Acidimicrobiia bacterium]
MNETSIKILVTAGSKHGATDEIARKIADVLTARGFEVANSAPDQVDDLSGYDAVVLGSAVYAGHWVAEAKALAGLVADAGPGMHVWLFSSGPIGDPPKPEEEPVDVAALVAETSARDHRVFAGKIDKSKLSFGEKAIVMALRAPEGDFRDWEQIEGWANEIAESLQREVRET